MTLVATPGILPLVLLALATAVGWGAGKISRGRRTTHGAAIAAHLRAGVAGFSIFLAWAKACSRTGMRLACRCGAMLR